MKLLIAGTIPVMESSLIEGQACFNGESLKIGTETIPCGMGTAAMASAALAVSEFLSLDPPYVLFAGDQGSAEGSNLIYSKLEDHVSEMRPEVIVLHYIQPIMGRMKRVVKALDKLNPCPFMIADAGAMYAAKAAGLARKFSMFTPDMAEMKFLADPDAMHPAYISNFLIQSTNEDVEELCDKAYAHGSIPQFVLVKGKRDAVVSKGKIVSFTCEPLVPELEPVGGTGDTITGLCAGLIAGGVDPIKSSVIATRLNRYTGMHMDVKPDTSVRELIHGFRDVMEKFLHKWLEEEIPG